MFEKPDVRITDLFAERKRPQLSLEFFPPKTETGMERLRYNAQLLTAVQPDFVTVTWGAGGSTRERTLEVCRMLRATGLRPVMPHLTCVGASREELRRTVQEMVDLGYRNIMTLRGDPPKGAENFVPHAEGLSYAAELVALIKEDFPEVCCGVAGYPEKHPEAHSLDEDVAFLKAKIEAGGDFVTTQLFYDNERYFDFYERCRCAGIDRMILPGILPVMSLKQVLRISEMCQAYFPPELREALEQAGEGSPEAEKVGLEWSVRQIEGLLEAGAPGVHLYILNDCKAALSLELMNCFSRIRY